MFVVSGKTIFDYIVFSFSEPIFYNSLFRKAHFKVPFCMAAYENMQNGIVIYKRVWKIMIKFGLNT